MIHRAIVSCQSFTLIGVAGSLLGSVPCFVKSVQKPGQHINSSHSGTFNLKKLKEGARLRSITHAKTMIGHAIVLLLQAGILEEFKNVPLASGLDMACFAGAVLASSAGVFLLSRLTVREQRPKETFA
ncbi:hypothetical protein PR202_gb11023 [Eleusine coracana subsp. coracana]|uniref:Uncharacterized protein n=1 Tax=Eleusine coracana subsp. coracana TaxID=191504 RepID=A0AAV5EJH2_ELECO|nr:hypothetical protein PR202_gb11023 [Eleusine coracana subsp. coracana]